ncbi:hypothetical protein PICMEDRAFT_16049 [Pichia membranifaciens NRRL Y-2026]|uniref:Uncharacterized protein n=1 Tax=Pichia membranifaciens NRRL Y-2026 TaxID=763406 RepID=A0A1E3NQ58_9ASCO|nr:hypothetical protein PICMEDRAFT_16049 [Pichia membranifaciens NRRL Y-2026]ODQ48239.1 hypothetical protein PICMEDRAFT_16049 [Pichia membranifaciens NRRL Y-2026]
MPAIPPPHTGADGDAGSQLQKLLAGLNHELERRDYDGFYGNSNPGRYAFFAFFAAAFIIFIVMICTVNARRLKSGRAPVISSYLSPPSYHQSQAAYGGETAATNLPTYTPAPNAQQDVGYYDKNGNFIPTNVTTAETTADASNGSNLAHPENGSIELLDTSNPNTNPNTYNNSNPFGGAVPATDALPTAHTQEPGINDPQNVSEMSYKRPSGPPPSQVYNSPEAPAVGSSNKVADNDLPPYEAPEAPSPTHYKS